MPDDLAVALHVGRDHRDADRHCLHERARQPLLDGGEDRDVRGRGELGDVVPVAQEVDGVGETVALDLRRVALAVGAVADQPHHRALRAGQALQRAQQQAVVLHRLEASDAEDDGTGVAGLEQPRPEAMQVDAVADVVDALPRPEAQAPDFLQVLAVLDEEHIAPAGEPAFRGHVRQPPRGRHVLVEVESVRCVDGDGDACEAGSDAADGPGDRIVRVHDGVTLGAQNAQQLEEQAGYADRRQSTGNV